jgi:predicted nucleotidyltransferase component of viral defense system
MLQYQTVSGELRGLLRFIQSKPEFSELRLVGGTALALQYGHRESVDLDFFGTIDLAVVSNKLQLFGDVKKLKESKNINVFVVNDIKVDFVNYTYPWIDEPVVEDGLTLASPKDIAAMKIAAITGRGSKKDFVDLYYLLNHYSIEEMMSFYMEKYPDATKILALKSLLYFTDADEQPMPKMMNQISWEEVKRSIKEVAESQLG